MPAGQVVNPIRRRNRPLTVPAGFTPVGYYPLGRVYPRLAANDYYHPKARYSTVAYFEPGTPSPPTPPGTAGSARQFTAANSEYLSTGDNATVSTGDIDFTFTCWVYADSLSGDWKPVFGKWASSWASSEYILYYTSSRFKWALAGSGGSGDYYSADSLGAAATGTWYFIVCWHDATANTANIQINDGTVDSYSHTAGVNDDTNDFNIGKDWTTNYWDGRIQYLGMWKRTLTANERTWLYGDGYGRAWLELGHSGPGSDLLTSLSAYWDLDEASGGALDDNWGGVDLTDNATVTTADGLTLRYPLGSARQFTAANSEYLSHADDDNFDMGDIDFAISVWVRADSLGEYDCVFSKWNNSNSLTEYVLYYRTGSTAFEFGVGDGTSSAAVQASTDGNPAATQWYHVVCEHDATANTISIQVNNGTIDSTAHTTGVLAGANAFQIGKDQTTNYWDGRVQFLRIWKGRTLDASDRTYLQGAGYGRFHADLAAQGLDTGLVASYDLDEASGNATDSSGNGLDLTDNNTVTTADGLQKNLSVGVFRNQMIEAF